MSVQIYSFNADLVPGWIAHDMPPKTSLFIKNKEKVKKIKVADSKRQEYVIKKIALHGTYGAFSSGQCAR